MALAPRPRVGARRCSQVRMGRGSYLWSDFVQTTPKSPKAVQSLGVRAGIVIDVPREERRPIGQRTPVVCTWHGKQALVRVNLPIDSSSKRGKRKSSPYSTAAAELP